MPGGSVTVLPGVGVRDVPGVGVTVLPDGGEFPHAVRRRVKSNKKLRGIKRGWRKE